MSVTPATARRDYVAEFLAPITGERNRVDAKSRRGLTLLRERLRKRRDLMQTGWCKMSGAVRYPALAAAASVLRAADVRFALLHEAALAAWGISYSVVLPAMDILLIDDRDAALLGLEVPEQLGTFARLDAADMPLRVWSRRSVGLSGSFDVVECPGYGCDALAPETVLEKLPYSPDARLLLEARARLAEVLFFDRMDDEQLGEFDSYVRGD